MHRSSSYWLPFHPLRPIKLACIAPAWPNLLLDMTESARVLQAATVLSQALGGASVPHAFHGSLLIALLSNGPQCNVCVLDTPDIPRVTADSLRIPGGPMYC